VFDVNETLLDLTTLEATFERIFGDKGAVAVGWQAALIKRVGNNVLGVGPQPQIVGADLDDVADQLMSCSNRSLPNRSGHGPIARPLIVGREPHSSEFNPVPWRPVIECELGRTVWRMGRKSQIRFISLGDKLRERPVTAAANVAVGPGAVNP
jgi:hypothetical protein